MSIPNAIAAELENNARISAIVSTRVYVQNVRPGAALPYIVVLETGGTGHTGHCTGVTTLAEMTGDIECYQTTAILSDVLAVEVRKALDGFRAADGSMGSGSYTANVRRFSLRAPIQQTIGPTDGSSDRIYVQVFPWIAWLQEAITV